MHYYNSIIETVGNTPLLRLRKIEARYFLPFALFGKLERFNPTGSVKDRTALSIMRVAKKRGLLHENTLVIEATSGNTGISLAMICAVYNLPLHIYMPENSSKERIAMMKGYGATVILTPKEEGMKGAERRADEEKAAVRDSFRPSQFDNPANPLAHFETAREIDEALGGEVSAIVAGLGTGGTMTGIAKAFMELGKTTSFIGVEPLSSPLYTKQMTGPHKIQGIGPNFKPAVFESNLLHAIVDVSDEDAYEMTRILAKEEGVFAGISSGAALQAAVKLDRQYHKGGNVVVILPDEGERYLSVEGLYA